mmetsp:Transcript_1265/g.2645  ORF Transcript_1265/g.2645 Transcript_1265/m.2645 type:complete len:258 (-) Transcript_1265:767-1540(-)
MGSGSIFQGHELVFIGTSEITSGSPHDLRKGLILRPIPIRLILHPSPQNTLRILRRPRIAPRPPRQILPLLDIRLRLYLTFRQKLLQPGIRLLRQRIRPHERIEDLPVFLVEGLTTRVVRIEPFAVAIGEEGIVAGEDVDDFGGGAETSSADDFVSVDGDGVVAFAVGAAQSAWGRWRMEMWRWSAIRFKRARTRRILYYITYGIHPTRSNGKFPRERTQSRNRPSPRRTIPPGNPTRPLRSRRSPRCIPSLLRIDP